MKAISGVKWTTLQTVLLSISGPILLIIKARFLTPTEFGVLAIITIFLGFFQTINNFGISQAIIQRDCLSKKELSSLFFFNIFVVIFLALCLSTLSGLIATLFSVNELSLLLKVMSIAIIVSGPSLVFRAILEKNLYFKELSLTQIFSEMVLVLSTIIFLLNGMGLIGIVLGQILSTCINTILILIISRKKELLSLTFYFNLKEIKPFINFGLYVSGKQIMTYITHRLDQLLIGYFLAPDILGIYNFAKSMLERLRSLITASFSKVLFPLLSKLKNDKRKLTLAYGKISRYIAVLSFPVFIGSALTSHLYVPVLFGDKWIESIPFFQVFSLILIPMVLTANLSSAFLYSINKPKIVFYVDLITNTLYIVLLGIFVSQGVYAVLVVYCFYVIIKTLILQYLSNKYLLNSFYQYLASFKKIFTASSIMTIVVLLVQMFFQHKLVTSINLVITIFIGASVYLLVIYFIDKSTLLELKSSFLDRKKHKKTEMV